MISDNFYCYSVLFEFKNYFNFMNLSFWNYDVTAVTIKLVSVSYQKSARVDLRGHRFLVDSKPGINIKLICYKFYRDF